MSKIGVPDFLIILSIVHINVKHSVADIKGTEKIGPGVCTYSWTLMSGMEYFSEKEDISSMSLAMHFYL